MKLGWRNSVGLKLSASLGLVIMLSLLPLAYVVGVSVEKFGIYSASVNEQQLRNQAIHYLSRLSREQGHKYEEYFNRIQAAVALLATEATTLYHRHWDSVESDLPLPVLEYQERNSMFLSRTDEPVLSIYWGGPVLDNPIRKEIGLLSLLDPLMMRTKAVLPDTLAVHMITTSGIGRYYTWNEKSREVARNLPPAKVFDLRDGAPLTVFTREKRSTDLPQWTPIYRDDVIDGLMLTSAGAMLDSNGTIMGEVGADLPLRTLVEDVLLDADISVVNGGQVLFSFLVGPTGRLIAFPLNYLDYFGFTYDASAMRHSDDVLKYSLQDSAEKGVRDLCSKLLKLDNIVQETEIRGEKHLIASQDLATLGWKFVLVSRDSDMISSVKRTQNALRGTLAKLRKEFLVTICVTLGLALFFTMLAIRHFVAPLKELAEVAESVGAGNLDRRSRFNRTDEIGALGKAMDRMIEQLAVAEKLRTDYSRLLENEISMRTRDLEEKNRELEKVVADLNEESTARRKVTEALIESERQLRSIMGSSLAGLCIIQDGRFQYVNNAMEELFGYTREQLLKATSPEEIVLEEFRDAVMGRLTRREEGAYLQPMRPYHIKCRRSDGTIIDVLVAGAGITWEGKPASVGTLVDISPLKRAEEKLLVNEKRLQASLEEKNVLLREVYHRTKNNMLVIISLLGLQKGLSGDSKVVEVFTEMENRIRAMAMVHENLYQTRNLSALQLGSYLENLIHSLVESMSVAGKIEVVSETIPLRISFDQAIPLGLITNELVTNSIKHAFGEGKGGRIYLTMKAAGEEVELVLGDNGRGISEEIDIRRTPSFGLQIAASMIEKQLGGWFSVSREEGTRFIIRFTARSLAENGSVDGRENTDRRG